MSQSKGKIFNRRRFMEGIFALGSAGLLSSGRGGSLVNKVFSIHQNTPVLASSIFSYDGLAAAAYADFWALGFLCDASSGPCFEVRGDDCTNFASKAMNAGGFPQDNMWFATKAWWELEWNYSTIWSVVYDLYDYLMYTGYGQEIATAPGTTTDSNTGLAPGDLVFYDWDSDGQVDHVAILTTPGSDGDEVDAHSNERYHQFWTLQSWNNQASTTTIHLVHIVSNTAQPSTPLLASAS
jgi:hypothetical protein